MPKKPGPKTESGEQHAARAFTLDPLTLKMLDVLANQHQPRNESKAVREAIKVAYDRYQKTL